MQFYQTLSLKGLAVTLLVVNVPVHMTNIYNFKHFCFLQDLSFQRGEEIVIIEPSEVSI